MNCQTTICQPKRAETLQFVPRCDIFETDKTWSIEADLPGVALTDIELNYENSILSIHGKVPATDASKDKKWIQQEYKMGDFVRKFTIKGDIDPENISADLKRGVLTVNLPKLQKTGKKHIAISSGVM